MTSSLLDSNDMVPGKAQYVPKWPLSIHLRPVLVKNFEICDINEALKYNELADYKNIWITVFHNNNLVTKEKLYGPIARKIYIRDDEPQTQSLSIAINGKTDDHSLLLGHVSLTIAVEVKISIGDIPANLLFFNLDPCLISENNKEYKATFQTPIFPHLIENQERIIGMFAKT